MISSIQKRNGESVPFDPSRIRKAIYGAFWEEFNDTASKNKTPQKKKGEPLDKKSEEDIQSTLKTALSLISEKKATSVEEIQDLVEMSLYREGFPKIAHRYVVYRIKHKKEREISEAAKKLTITKSSGEIVPYNPTPIINAAKAACHGVEEVSSDFLYNEIESTLYDSISTKEITESMLATARTLIEKEPNYSLVTARLLLQRIGEEAFGELNYQFTAAQIPINYNGYFQNYIQRAVELEMLRPEMLEFNLEELAKTISPERDLLFHYLGLKTLYDRYLIKTKYGVCIEMPQAFWMRVAMGLARLQPDKNKAAIRYYNVLSELRGLSSTPTLFNAGTNHEQLSSCYLLTVDDTIEGIFKNFSDNARLSKWAGGIGNDWSAIRGRGGYIKGTNGESQGGVPWWKLTNDTAVAVNQGSKRKGAICNYLETWHIDLLDFLDLRKNTGDERARTHDLNTANWIPDLFMKRLEEEESTWWMFSPNTVPDLHDLYGAEFEKRYLEIEKEVMEGPTTTVTDGNLGITIRTLPENKYHPARRVETQSLWRKMLTALFETGHPWIVFKDPGNIRNPQDHVGVIHSSNLCTEIFLNTSASTINPETNAIEQCGEVAVCNLASINLAKHIVQGKLNEPMLKETTQILVEMLDNVIDINFYPIAEAKKSNLQHRPIGLGIMGFHTAIQTLGIPYASQDAIEFSDVAQEIIALAAIEASSDLAVSRGKYPSYEGSKWSRGILPLDSVKLIEEDRGSEFTKIDYSSTFPEEWERLRQKILKQGMRNSNVMAIAPTATIANIAGVSEGITPEGGILYTKENLSGTFTVCNPILVRELKKLGLWNDIIISKIKMREGSIQTIQEIPQEIRDIFKHAYEIPAEFVIEAASRRQKWMDQGQSCNLFVFQPTGKALSDMYRLAWRVGLKSTYYLRSKSASVREKTTVGVQSTGIGTRLSKEKYPSPEKVAACSLEAKRKGEECEACQ